ncbi:hypothetical protein DL768_005592 [Monosporascus sp. mg162]|nr:hypothetical protein DL768_005592 [Monosporascus sp. mg162]
MNGHFGSRDRSIVALYATFWCEIETFLILIASFAPFLKTACERVLRRLHLSTLRGFAMTLNSYHTGIGVVPEEGYQLDDTRRLPESVTSNEDAFIAGKKKPGHKSEAGESQV